MRKYIVFIFSIVCCFSAIRAQKITHSVQLKFFGSYASNYRYSFHKDQLSCSLLSYGVDNFAWNLIPSYELGYKDKWFFKLEHSYTGMSGEDLLQANVTYEKRTHYINFYANYNFFPVKWSAHRLKLGIGPGMSIESLESFDDRENNSMSWKNTFCNITIGAELAYQWTVYKGLYVGLEASYIHTLVDFGPFTYDYNVAMGITVGYTFNSQARK